MYAGRPDHGNLDYAGMAFGMAIFVDLWLWLGGMPETTAAWVVRLGLLGVGVGGLLVVLWMKSRIE
jgi:hypothetical protein